MCFGNYNTLTKEVTEQKVDIPFTNWKIPYIKYLCSSHLIHACVWVQICFLIDMGMIIFKLIWKDKQLQTYSK